MREILDQIDRVLARQLVIDAGVRDVEVEYCRDHVKNDDQRDRNFRRGVDAALEVRDVDLQHFG